MCEGFLILDLTTFENVCWKKEYAVATKALKKLERTSELEGFWQSNRGCRDLNLKYLLMVFFSPIHSIIINTTRLMCKISTIAYATSDPTNITHISPPSFNKPKCQTVFFEVFLLWCKMMICNLLHRVLFTFAFLLPEPPLTFLSLVGTWLTIWISCCLYNVLFPAMTHRV